MILFLPTACKRPSEAHVINGHQKRMGIALKTMRSNRPRHLLKRSCTSVRCSLRRLLIPIFVHTLRLREDGCLAHSVGKRRASGSDDEHVHEQVASVNVKNGGTSLETSGPGPTSPRSGQ